MIRSFRSKPLKQFFETGRTRGLSVQDTRRVARILAALDDAGRPDDMNIPGYHFHGLTGEAKGRYSLRVTANWRITFGWDGADATEVDLEDYH